MEMYTQRLGPSILRYAQMLLMYEVALYAAVRSEEGAVRELSTSVCSLPKELPSIQSGSKFKIFERISIYFK